MKMKLKSMKTLSALAVLSLVMLCGLQRSRRSTANQFGTSRPEPGFGLRHSLRTELCWLPRRGRPWRSGDRPGQSRVPGHRR